MIELSTTNCWYGWGGVYSCATLPGAQPKQATFGAISRNAFYSTNAPVTYSYSGLTIGGAASGGKYTNTGTIGVEVQTATDRYFVYPDGTYSLINHVPSVVQACGSGTNSLSLINTASSTTDPLCTSYAWTVPAPNGASAQSLSNMIIDPFHGQQVYDFTNDTVNLLPSNQYIYTGPGTVAPITLQ